MCTLTSSNFEVRPKNQDYQKFTLKKELFFYCRTAMRYSHWKCPESPLNEWGEQPQQLPDIPEIRGCTVLGSSHQAAATYLGGIDSSNWVDFKQPWSSWGLYSKTFAERATKVIGIIVGVVVILQRQQRCSLVNRKVVNYQQFPTDLHVGKKKENNSLVQPPTLSQNLYWYL
jgi:hypothetical protein